MKIQFLLVPYDSGRREWRMGRGPSYLLKHGVGSSIRAGIWSQTHTLSILY